MGKEREMTQHPEPYLFSSEFDHSGCMSSWDLALLTHPGDATVGVRDHLWTSSDVSESSSYVCTAQMSIVEY